MRKSLTIFLLFILFFSALVIAEEEGINGITTEEDKETLPLKDSSEVDSDAKKTLDELKSGLVDASKKTNLWNETKIIFVCWVV